MKCPRCGGDVPSGARACPYCTTLVSDFKNIVPYGGQPQKPEKKRGCLGCLIPILVVFGILFIVLVVFAIFSSGDDSSTSSASSKSTAPYNPRTSSSAQDSTSGAYSSNPQYWDSSDSTPDTDENTSSGNLGDYDVEIKSAITTTDYEGNPAIVVTYSWTNNSDETTSCMASVIASAFQDGVELETAIIMDDSVFDANPYMKDVRPGTTIDIQQAFELTSSSNVEIEITELFSFDDKAVTETFQIQ